MPDAAGYTWDREAVRFRDSSGRFVPQTRVREAIDAFATGVADELEQLTRRLIAGEINDAQWEIDAKGLLKSAHIATAAIASGGRDKLTPVSLGKVGSRLKKEYEYLFNLSRARGRGEVSDAQLIARIRMFGEGSTRAYESARRGEMIDAGYTRERRVIASSVPCPECQDYAARGWQHVGTLPATGEACSCRSNCKCYFIFEGKSARRGVITPPDSPVSIEQPPASKPRAKPPAPGNLPAKDAPLPSPDLPGLTFTASDRSQQSKDKVVWVDVRRLDTAWAADDPGFRVQPGGQGPSARPSSYTAFGDYLSRSLAMGRPIEMSRVYLDGSGKISFLDGRHRFAWMRDNGMGRVPVAVPKEAARRLARAYGIRGPER